jgi:hypothetical protein
MEEIYIGTKVIAAEEMGERDFAFSKGQAFDENRPSRVGYKVRYEDGYVSWSPKETFERAYRKVTGPEKEMVLGSIKIAGELGKTSGITFKDHHIRSVYSEDEQPKDMGKEE